MPIKIEPFQDERPWGYFRQFCQNATVTVKILSIKPGEMFSLQSHAKRAEFWRVITGSGIAEIDNNSQEIKIGDEMTIPFNIKHRLIAGLSGLEVLEISYGDFDENDITRYEDKYGRL